MRLTPLSLKQVFTKDLGGGGEKLPEFPPHTHTVNLVSVQWPARDVLWKAQRTLTSCWLPVTVSWF